MAPMCKQSTAAYEPIPAGWKPSTWDEVCANLASEDIPVEKRYRAMLSTRKMAPSAEALRKCLLAALASQKHSELMRHELCFVMGQTMDVCDEMVNGLLEVLENEEDAEIARHEAAEALAAMVRAAREPPMPAATRERVEAALVPLCDRMADLPALAETCQLALAGIREEGVPDKDDAEEEAERKGERGAPCACQFSTTDPAIGKEGKTAEDIPDLAAELADESKPLYDRYVAMFTLRNMRSVDAATVIADQLVTDKSSPVLRHELAFVLGQIAAATSKSRAAMEGLRRCMANEEEHGMVRHEAVLALGYCHGDRPRELLEPYLSHPDELLSETARVAVSLIDYRDVHGMTSDFAPGVDALK